MDYGNGGGGEESEYASSEKGGKIKKTSSFFAELTGVKSTKRMQVRDGRGVTGVLDYAF